MSYCNLQVGAMHEQHLQIHWRSTRFVCVAYVHVRYMLILCGTL